MNLRSSTLFSLLLLASACDGSSADTADASTAVDASVSTPDGALSGYPTLEDFPECDENQPSVACIRKLFLPLRTTTLPFDGNVVADALDGSKFYVGSDWQLTVLHAIEANSLFPTQCYVGEYWFSSDGAESIDVAGCGEFLFVGGHPRSLECKEENVFVRNCVDQVPVREAFDIGLLRAETPGAKTLAVAGETPAVGDPAFVVGLPFFSWLTKDERESLRDIFPVVSFGKVIAVDGRGIVTDNLVFGGNSGGPLLNASGQAMGILYTKISDVRGQGTETDTAWLDRYSVSVGIEQAMLDIIGVLAQP